MSFDNLLIVVAVAAAIPLLLGLVRQVSVPGPVLEIVATTQIGLVVHAVTPANAAALVAAGLVSVLVYPAVALRLLRPTKTPTVLGKAVASRASVRAASSSPKSRSATS